MIATEPQCIADRRAVLEKQLAELDGYVPHAEVAAEVFADREAEIRYCAITDSIRVDLYVDDPSEVVPYLRALAQRGYHATKGNEFYEDDNKTCRCYTRGKIKVWTQLTGRKCRRVQVGVKEVPVYEIECGDEAAT